MADYKTTIDKLSQVIQEAITRHGWVFTMQKEPLSSDEVASPNGFLPLLLENASMVAQEALGDRWKYTSHYVYDQKALCQMIPSPDAVGVCPISALALCIDYTLEKKVEETLKLVPASKKNDDLVIPLDDWMEKFIERYKLGFIQLDMPSTPTPGNQV